MFYFMLIEYFHVYVGWTFMFMLTEYFCVYVASIFYVTLVEYCYVYHHHHVPEGLGVFPVP